MSERRGTEAPEPQPPDEAIGSLARLEGRLDDVAQRFDKTDWVELVAAVVLAIATVLAAWGAYQSSRWGGEQAKATNEANAQRLVATNALSFVQTRVLADGGVVIAWTQAALAGDEQGMAVFESQIRDDFRPAFDAWLETAPSGGLPTGDPTDLPEYDEAIALTMETAQEATEAAQASLERASEANQLSDNFVLGAVVMASVLFFAGVGSKFRGRRLRVTMVLLAAVVLLIGFLFMASMPQNVGL